MKESHAVRWRGRAMAALSTAVIVGFGFASTASATVARQDAGARIAAPCGAVLGSPAAEAPAISAAGGLAMDVEFDQRFIDMNIPHHAAIVSGAVAALTRLEHPQLREIAKDIVMDQTAELDKLRDVRQLLYGESLPMPIDEQMLAMMPSMPGMEGIDPAGMAIQMDPAAMAERMCSAENVDLTFIDLTVAHHEAAVVMAQAALEQAASDEVRAIAAHAVSVQTGQIAELEQIRAALAGAGTPEPGA